MRIGFRQGIVSHQAGGFLQVSGNVVNILAASRHVTVTLAHKDTNYTYSEDNSVSNAWIGPFTDPNYWLYWDFNTLTFVRTFNHTTIEPVAQSVEPGSGNSSVVGVTPGAPGVGAFVVDGFYNLATGKVFAVVNSTGNNGNYTVLSISYNNSLGQTTIYVNEAVASSIVDGDVTLDIDSSGNPLYMEGRHWFNTTTNEHFVLNGGVWQPVLRVFAAQLLNGNTLISVSQNSQSGIFTGTQIGNNNEAATGRVLVDVTGKPIGKDNGTFFTTESEFFTSQSRVDALRLESNVTRAQSIGTALSKYSVVAWKADGQIDAAQYDDTGNTVVGLLTEDIVNLETGAVIVQGAVTNSLWNWTNTVSVGATLWIENGQLVTVDPNISDPVTYPTQQVPVARVLDKDTVIFEQGLGGIGPRGPAGGTGSLSPADTTNLGVVTLLTPSSNAARAFVISDTDSRLTNARAPLTHNHQASDVAFLAGAGIVSNDVQSALVELGNGKVDIAGAVMTGLLTLSADPATDLNAATKRYVDNLVNGLIWLEPVHNINLIGDDLLTPPGSPNRGDSYILPSNAGTGAWLGIPQGNVVQWNPDIGSPSGQWIDIGGFATFHPSSPVVYMGIAMQSATTARGSFAGQKNQIRKFTSGVLDTTPIVPVSNNAVFVVGDDSLFAFSQFVFDGTKWVIFGSSSQAFVGDGLTIDVTGTIISAIPSTSSGQIDALTLAGNTLVNLDARWAALAHQHSSSQTTFTPHVSDGTWGTPDDSFSGQLASTDAQTAIGELANTKAEKTPSYAVLGNLPSAISEKGMVATVLDGSNDTVFFADGANWQGLSRTDHTHNNPYDIEFFITGPLPISKNLCMFAIPRIISVAATAATSRAIVTVPATASPTTLLILRDVAPTYTSPVPIGSISFAVGSNTGVITWGSNVTFAPGDRIIIATDSAPSDVDEISITIVACEPVVECVPV